MTSSKSEIEKPFLQALRGRKPSRLPIWLMRQAGRYLPEYRATRAKAGSFLGLCYNPEFAAEVTFQPIRRYGFDASILFADILLICDAMGQKLDYREGEGPVLEPVRDIQALNRLSGDGIHDRLAPVYETVKLLRQGLPAETALIGFAGAPWTVATYMVEGRGSSDHARSRRWAYGAPDEFARLINLLVGATSEYLCRQIEAGAEAVQIFDTWAGSLNADGVRKWVIEPTLQVIRNIRARHPGIPVIGFPRSIGVLYPEFVAATGVDAVSIDSVIPPEWAAAHIQPKACVQGNLDPQVLVAGGGVMHDQVARIVATLSKGSHVFNLAHGIVPETPPEHVDELVKLVRRLG